MNTNPSSLPPDPQVNGDMLAANLDDKAKILIVDDRPDKLLALQSIITDLGEEIILATSGKEALRCLLQQDFAVILLDVSMPIMDGFETASLIRQRKKSEHTPIIFVSALNDHETHVTRGYSIGAVDYIMSPIEPEILKTKVSVFVELFRKTQQIRIQGEKLRELQERKHRETITSVLGALPDAVFLVGSNRHILLKNPSADILLGKLNLVDSFPAHINKLIDEVFTTGVSFQPTSFNEVIRFEIPRENHYFLPRIVPIREENGHISSVVVLIQDVTQFHLLDEVKTDLIGTVSHELKTPITTVRMFLHLILEKNIGPLNEKQEELLTIARDDAERLLRTLNNLLDLTRFDQGTPLMAFEKMSIETIFEEVLKEVGEVASRKKVSLTTEFMDGLPAILVDPKWIGHVFINLVMNAIKYSPEGETVRVRVTSETDSLKVTVSDRGPGVPLEFKNHIFEKFFRVPGQQKTGAGLGLAIAKQFVRAHQGEIGVSIPESGGSEFYVILPLSLENHNTVPSL
ncbi:MAG: response regulator [Verrucomicrobiota bacterium]|nr:response regulator [Verrucomicrobiota bacterium]